MNVPVLQVEGLRVAYGNRTVLHDVGFALQEGEMLALVGLSGCGKTTIMRALLGLLPASAQVSGRLQMRSGSTDLAARAGLHARLGREIGFVAQNPFDACAPLRPVRAHIEEAWRAHGLAPDPGRIADLCRELALDPAMLALYPHEWSGGMLQRANIAAATALLPPVLLADEPTSALDAENAEAAIACLRGDGRAVLLVSHDLDLVARTADRVILIEDGSCRAQSPAHGLRPGYMSAPFADFARTGEIHPPARPDGAEMVLEARNLMIRRGGRQVLSDVSLALRMGEVLGIAGPSGSGKSTLLAALAGHLPVAAGVILRDGQSRAPLAREVLPLHQDALASMNPRWPLQRIIAEPLTVGAKLSRAERAEAAGQAQSEFGLASISPAARPATLSTGQSQRAVLARASLARARVFLADEPTSALDPRQAAAALAGIARLVEQQAAAVIVSHDITMLRRFCHRVMLLP